MPNVLSPHNYQFNLHALPVLLGGVLLIILGAFVIGKSRKLLNVSFFLWAMAGSFWLLGNGFTYMATADWVVWELYNKYEFLGVAFISIFGYLFSLSWERELLEKQKKYVVIACVISAIFYLTNLKFTYILSGVYNYYWGRYFKNGLGGTLFIIYWIIPFLLMMRNYIVLYTKATGLKKNQYKVMVVATCIVYLGALDWLPCYGLEVYPFGYITTVIFFVLVAYNIIHYRAFEIETVVHKTILWILTSLWLIIPGYVILSLILPWLKNLNTLSFTAIELILFYLFLNYYLIFQPRIDHLFRRRKYDYQTVLGKIAEKIATCINIEHLSQQLLTEVCDTMYLSSGLFYLISKDEQKYKLIGRFSKGSKEVEIFDDVARKTLVLDTAEIKAHSTLCSWLDEHHDIIEQEHLEIDPEFETAKTELTPWFHQHSLEILIPVLFENKVIGILGLGKKENLQNYTLKDKELLKKLGEEAGVTIFNALHYKDVLEKERLQEEVKMGQQIQMNLLPQGAPDVPGLEIVGYMHPAKEIGGDYYDFIHRPYDNEFAFVIGDVSGKGVGAGIVMSMVKMAVNTLSQQMFSPKEILCSTNTSLYSQVKGEKFVTLLYFLWQPAEKKLSYSSAGHEHILVHRSKNQEIETIKSGGLIVGMLPNIEEYLEELNLLLEPGDKMLLYTDGATDAINPQGERMELEHLIGLFKKYCALPPSEMILCISDEVFVYMEGAAQYDDITFIALEAK